MIVTGCKSIVGTCPCEKCKYFKKYCASCLRGLVFDTEILCEKARKYCEEVNGKND